MSSTARTARSRRSTRRRGAVVATVPVAAGPNPPAVDAEHGRVYVLSSGYRAVVQGPYVSYAAAGAGRPSAAVSALDARSGRVVWTAPLAGLQPLDSRPGAIAVDARRARVFVVDGGILRNSSPPPPPPRSGGRGAASRAAPLLALSSGGVNVLDAATGKFLRRVAVGPTADAVAMDEQGGHAFVATLYGVSMLDPGPARGRGATLAGAGHAGGLTVAAGHVYTLDHDDAAAAVFDARTGAALATTASIGAHPVALTVDAAAGRLFILDGGIPGHVGTFAVRDGRLLHTAAVGADPWAIAVDEVSGRAFIANRMSGTVSVLDARTGVLVRTVRVGRDPIAVAVDARAGRAFVVCRDSGRAVRPARDPWAWLPGPLRARLPFLPHPPAPTPRSRGAIVVIDASH